MSDLSLPSSRRIEPEIAAMITTFLVVNFLFFIDEGYYDFRWMMDWGNWVVFAIYFIIGYPIFWSASKFLFKRLEGWKKLIADVGVAVVLLAGVLFLLS